MIARLEVFGLSGRSQGAGQGIGGKTACGGTRGMLTSFDRVLSCLAQPTAACLTALPVLAAWAGALALAILLSAPIGWKAAVRDGRAARGTFGKLALAAVAVAASCAVAMAALLYAPPEVLPGAERALSLRVLWQAMVCALAIVGLAGAAAAGFGLGGFGARVSGAASRLGLPGVVIAIDGPAASGKGTLAKRVAEHYRVPCLDTGLLYRAVARDVLAAGNDLADAAAAVACAKALDPATFDDPALRGASAGDAASVVARIPEVRAALLDYQRTFAKSSMGAVLDGRDIGTVVCPEAPVKIYVTASAQERARRRYAELENRGEGIRFQDVLEDIHRRDARDTGRAVAPLLPAKDAFQLDTTYMNIEQAFVAAVDIIESRLAGARPPPAVGATEA